MDNNEYKNTTSSAQVDTHCFKKQDPQTTNKSDHPYNKYYLIVSNRFRVAKILVISFLCFFVFFSLFFYGEAFTYENARYILRDLGQILSEESATPSEQITVDADGDMDFAVFRNNIVCAGESNTKILSITGNEKLSDRRGHANPTVVTGNKYCVVYSLGSEQLSVYNTVARVYDMKFDFPIYDVAVSDNGDIAVMTRSRDYRCVVYLYDSDFKLKSTYNRTAYPSSVSLSQDGLNVLICTLDSSDGEYLTELTCYKQATSKPLYSLNFAGRLPIDLCFMSVGSACVSFNDGILFIDPLGEIISSYNYTSSITSCHLGKDSIALSLLEGKAVTYDPNGSVISSISDTGIVSAYSFDSYLVIEKKEEIKIICGDQILTHPIDSSPKRIIYSNGYLYLCYSHNIRSIKIY